MGIFSNARDQLEHERQGLQAQAGKPAFRDHDEEVQSALAERDAGAGVERKFVDGFTPGPWRAHDDDGTGTLPCVLAKHPTTAGNFYVAQCNVFADAKLIALAPELLSVCQRLVVCACMDLKGMELPQTLSDIIYSAKHLTGQ